MPLMEFSQEDIDRSKIVDPGWYTVLVTAVQDKLSNDQQSTNTWISGKILCNDDTGDKKFASVPTPTNWLFNSKAKSNAIGYIQAMTGSVVKPGDRVDLQSTVGKHIGVFIGNGIFNNQTQNQITHQYRQPKQKVG